VFRSNRDRLALYPSKVLSHIWTVIEFSSMPLSKAGSLIYISLGHFESKSYCMTASKDGWKEFVKLAVDSCVLSIVFNEPVLNISIVRSPSSLLSRVIVGEKTCCLVLKSSSCSIRLQVLKKSVISRLR
jgi:hypothetical protein